MTRIGNIAYYLLATALEGGIAIRSYVWIRHTSVCVFKFFHRFSDFIAEPILMKFQYWGFNLIFSKYLKPWREPRGTKYRHSQWVVSVYGWTVLNTDGQPHLKYQTLNCWTQLKKLEMTPLCLIIFFNLKFPISIFLDASGHLIILCACRFIALFILTVVYDPRFDWQTQICLDVWLVVAVSRPIDSYTVWSLRTKR